MMLARSFLHSAVRKRAASSSLHTKALAFSSSTAPWRGASRVEVLEAQLHELKPRVTKIERSMPQLQGEVQQVAFQVTVKELSQEVTGMKQDLKNLRQELTAGVAQAPIMFKEASTETTSANYFGRFKASFEVSVSKLFPGGFGWQAFSGIADSMGFAGNTFGFAVLTGFGDAVGVGLGHVAYHLVKKSLYPNSDINMNAEVSTATLLGSAAMISGTLWQPAVNCCGLLGLNFYGTFAATGVVCGAGFYAGLRIFRALYSPVMTVAPPSYQNLVADAQLSVSIAGAAGTFTATDPGLVGNFYSPLIGVQETDAFNIGCVKAGASTWLGFLKVQSAQNILYSRNRNWIDGLIPK